MADQKVQSYRDLTVWQRAMDLAKSCYLLTRDFPREEIYGMTSQIRRVAVSIPSNVAEGYGRGHRAEYLQHLYIAQGSLKELETQLILAGDVGVAAPDSTAPLLTQCEGVGRLLTALIRALSPDRTKDE